MLEDVEDTIEEDLEAPIEGMRSDQRLLKEPLKHEKCWAPRARRLSRVG